MTLLNNTVLNSILNVNHTCGKTIATFVDAHCLKLQTIFTAKIRKLNKEKKLWFYLNGKHFYLYLFSMTNNSQFVLSSSDLVKSKKFVLYLREQIKVCAKNHYASDSFVDLLVRIFFFTIDNTAN